MQHWPQRLGRGLPGLRMVAALAKSWPMGRRRHSGSAEPKAASPPIELADAIEHLLKRRPISWKQVCGGYTAAARWLVQLGGTTAFVKWATTLDTTQMIHREQQVYGTIHASFMPACEGMGEVNGMPFILLEDLSHGRWPPPWDAPSVEAVLATIGAMHDFPCKDPVIGDARPLPSNGWRQVAADPEPFLNLSASPTAP